MYEAAEGVDADGALSEGGVSVDFGGEGFEGVVEVHSAEVLGAYEGVEFGPEGVVAGGGGDVVAGGEGVAGVDAYAYAGGVVDLLDDACYMPESEAHVGALPGGVLDDEGDAVGLAQDDVDAVGYEVEAGVGVGFFEVAAWVEVEHGEAEGVAAASFVD